MRDSVELIQARRTTGPRVRGLPAIGHSVVTASCRCDGAADALRSPPSWLLLGQQNSFPGRDLRRVDEMRALGALQIPTPPQQRVPGRTLPELIAHGQIFPVALLAKDTATSRWDATAAKERSS